MYPVLTVRGSGRDRLARGLEALCEVIERHLPLLLATDEAFHQAAAPGGPASYLTRSSISSARARRTARSRWATRSHGHRRSRVQRGRVDVCPPARQATAGRRRRRGRGSSGSSWTVSPTVPREGGEMSTMTLPYREPLVPREPGERQIPEPPRRGEPGGPPCAICAGKTTPAVWSDEQLDAAPAGRRQPARRGLAREPRARRLVRATCRPTLAREFGVVAGADRARDPLARRRRARPPLPLGRRRRALPRLVPAAAARHARGCGDDAPALGGRAAERARRGARRSRPSAIAAAMG